MYDRLSVICDFRVDDDLQLHAFTVHDALQSCIVEMKWFKTNNVSTVDVV